MLNAQQLRLHAEKITTTTEGNNVTKKQERVKYLVGIHSALCGATCSVEVISEGVYCFDHEKIGQILATVKHLLKLDGITDGNA